MTDANPECQLVRELGRALWHLLAEDGRPLCGTTIRGEAQCRTVPAGMLSPDELCLACRRVQWAARGG
jgi:hypothetical protein